MTVTPSTQSGVLAGMGASVLLWGIILKIDAVSKLFRLDWLINKERILNWITDNKALFIVIVETVNFAVHGISNSAAIAVAIGIAIINGLVVFVCLPLRAMTRKNRSFV